MYCATGLSLALHGADRQTRGGRQRYSVYSLYWYKSANTDAEGADKGTHFTCFTGTKVWEADKGTQFTPFTGAKVQLLTQRRLRDSTSYLLYWYVTRFTGTKVQILTKKRLRKSARSWALCIRTT
jgi:hypothetical protein